MSFMKDINGVRLDSIAVATVQDVADEASARVDQFRAQIPEQVWAEAKFVASTLAGVVNTPVNIDGVVAIVPPCDTAQVITMQTTISISVAGGGYFTYQLYDVTTGLPALLGYQQLRIEPGHPVASPGERVSLIKRMDPHTDYRVLTGYFTLARDGGSSLQVGIANTGAEYAKSSIQVVKV